MSIRHRITCAGSAFSYLELGDRDCGRDMLLLHGWGLSASVYLDLAAHIAERGWHVVVVELPGFGRSDPPATLDYTGYSASIAEFTSHLFGGKAVTVLGHSLGGGIGWMLAREHPSLVERLILVDCTGIPVRYPLPVLCLRKLADVIVQLSPQTIAANVRMSAGSALTLALHPLALYRTLRLATKGDLSTTFGPANVPVSLWWARRDMVLPIDGGRRIAELLRIPLRMAPDRLGHDWCITHPSVLADALAE